MSRTASGDNAVMESFLGKSKIFRAFIFAVGGLRACMEMCIRDRDELDLIIKGHDEGRLIEPCTACKKRNRLGRSLHTVVGHDPSLRAMML